MTSFTFIFLLTARADEPTAPTAEEAAAAWTEMAAKIEAAREEAANTAVEEVDGAHTAEKGGERKDAGVAPVKVKDE